MFASTQIVPPKEREISAMLLLQESVSGRRPTDHRLKVPMPIRKNALLCGYDRSVSDTRKMLLESIAYQVYVANNTDEALQFVVAFPIETMIVCHTVPCEAVESLMIAVHSLQPSTRFLLLASGRLVSNQHLGDAVHDTADGPAAFLQKVRQMSLTSRLPY